ncbi:MAG: hypothetical protein KDK38_02560, partial [Leptospiraceae bacterium]|nr:hypothetical protein [Leptospiraceae bacterium]
LIEGNSDSQITVTMLMIYSLVFLVIGILLASGSYYNKKSIKDAMLIFLIFFAFALTSWLLRGYFHSHIGKIQFGFQGDNIVYQVTDGEKNEKRKQALPITSINSMVYQVGESAFSVSKMLRPAPGVKLEDTVDWSRENTITINFEFLSQFERIVVYLALHNHIEKIKLEQCSKKRNCAGATGSWSSN